MRAMMGLTLTAALWVAGAAHAAPPGGSTLSGSWGGDRAQLTFSASGAQLELECAAGRIPGPVQVTQAGRFEAVGSFEQLRGGPQRQEPDAQPRPNTTRYAGQLSAGILTLQVWPEASEPPLVFKLRKGATVKMVRCY